MIWHMAGLSDWCWELDGILVAARAAACDEPFYATDRVRRSVILEARWVLAIYAAALVGSIAAGSTVLLWYWVIPASAGPADAAALSDWPSIPPVRAAPTCSRIRAPPTPTGWCASSPGTCRSTPSITPGRRSRSTPLPQTNALIRDKLRKTAPSYRAALGDIWQTMRAGKAL